MVLLAETYQSALNFHLSSYPVRSGLVSVVGFCQFANTFQFINRSFKIYLPSELKRASPYDPGLTGYDPRAGDCEIIPITPAVTPPESVSPTDATIKAVVKAHRRPPAVPGTGSRLFYIIPSPSYGRYIFYAPFQVPLYYRSYVPVKRRPYTYKYISPVKSQRAGSSEEWRRKREAPSILGKEGRMKDAKQKPNAALYFHSLKHIAPTNLEVEGNN